MADIPKMLAAAHNVKRLYDDVLIRANVQDSGEFRVSAILCLTIAEQFAAVLCLVESGYSSHAPILVRSMLEGLANLINLVNDANYLDQIRYENARDDVILFEEYAADPEMQKDKKAIATLASWKDKAKPVRDELASKGFQKQKIITKFKKANILENYVVYRVFCSFAHNQLTTLQARHAGKFLHYHYEAPPAMTGSTLTVAASILSRAINMLPSFTDISASELKSVIDIANTNWTAACS
jgi:hypothetical protein